MCTANGSERIKDALLSAAFENISISRAIRAAEYLKNFFRLAV